MGLRLIPASADLSSKYRLTPNIEPMPWLAVDMARKAKRLLDVVSRGKSGVLVDAIHFYRGRNSLKDLSGIKTNYIQLCDTPKETPVDLKDLQRQARSDRLMPGDGSLDLAALLEGAAARYSDLR